MLRNDCLPQHSQGPRQPDTLATGTSLVSGARLLVVDDQDVNIFLMNSILRPEGYNVACATNGESALLMAKAEPQPELILLDAMMPGMDGYAVCTRLKADDATRHIPVIFVTAVDDAQTEARCFALGAADYIVKPVSLSTLLARIKAHLALYMQQRSLEGMFRDVLEFAPDALVLSDSTGHIVGVNAQAERLLGYPRQELLGQLIEVLLPEQLRARHPAQREALIAGHAPHRMGHGLSVLVRRKDGSKCDVEVNLSRIATAQGVLFVSSLRDISERKAAETNLRIAAIAFETQEGVIVTDANSVILRVNRAFSQMSGYSPEELVGKKPKTLQSGRHDANFYHQMWDTIGRTGGWQGEIWDRRKNGEIYPKWLSIAEVRDKDGVITHYVGAQSDMTSRKEAEEKIHTLAFYDPLTNLPNRTLLMDRLKQAMTATDRSDQHGALLFIDLDNFKNLNDTLGHDVGDLLLKQVAQRLSQCVREGDTVARLGGDEFVLILTNLSARFDDAAIDTETVAGKIIAALNQVYRFGESSYHSTASMGATLFKGLKTSMDDLIKQTDLTMYKAKDHGRNTFLFFDPAMELALKERSTMETALRLAIEERQFVLHYQVQVSKTGQVTGAEVLVRWRHPLRGLVSPADFIPLAERTGLILPLGHWVLETACKQLAIWADQPAMAQLTVAVNVSAHQFRQGNFVDQVQQLLARTGAKPERLKLELTESLMVDDVVSIIDTMNTLKSSGVSLSLDDFGTGYSSLSHLKNLPLDQLKIDQSFVRDVMEAPNDAAIAKAIVALSESLGLDVIAEGVETQAQRDFLATAGCHSYQGYLFGRPMPLTEFEALVQQVPRTH